MQWILRRIRRALRGGNTIFSPNGERALLTTPMHELDPGAGFAKRVAPFGPVNVQKQHPPEYGGSHWCVLVVKPRHAAAWQR